MFANTVRRTLEELRAADPSFQRFGASTHRYELNPVLKPEAVAAFEANHGIRLPEDYKEFVLTVGNGGAGPYYGIYPLLLEGNVDHRLRERNHIDLTSPFPHVAAWDESSMDAINWDEGERPDDETLDAYLHPRHISGALCISQFGCGDFLLLVVNGAERGNIWFDGRGNYSGIFPEEGAGTARISFSEWYLAWLDESIKDTTRDSHAEDIQ
jgi:hypothetical protein